VVVPYRTFSVRCGANSEGRRHRIILFWGCAFLQILLACSVNPCFGQKIINTIQKQGVNNDKIDTISKLLILSLIIDVTFWGFHGPSRIMEQMNAFWSRVTYRKFLLQGVMMQPLEWHNEYHSGDTIDKIEKGTSALFEFSEESYEIVSAIISLLVSYGMLVYYLSWSSVIVLFMVFLAMWITVKFDHKIVEQYGQLNRIDNQISASVFDAISNISTIIICGQNA